MVTIGGIISGIDMVRLIGEDFELIDDTEPDTDCGVIGVASVMNSIVSLRASGLVQQGAVESVIIHPPGSINFAIGRVEVEDDDDELRLLPESLVLVTCIVFSTIANPSCSETSLVTDRSSSLLSRIKLAKEDAIRFVFEFIVVVSGTVSNPTSSVIDLPPSVTLTLEFALLLLYDNIVGLGRMRMVVSQEIFLLERLDADDSDAATRENARRSFAVGVGRCPLMLLFPLSSPVSSDWNRRGSIETKIS